MLGRKAVLLLVLSVATFLLSHCARLESAKLDAELQSTGAGFYHGPDPGINRWDFANITLLVLTASFVTAALWLRKR
jgi:hypothetical protein